MLNFIEFNDPFSTGNGRARNSTIGFHFTAFNFRRRFDWQDFFPQSVHVLWILNDMNCFHCTDDYAYLSWLLIGILLCFFLLNFAGASIRKIFKMIRDAEILGENGKQTMEGKEMMTTIWAIDSVVQSYSCTLTPWNYNLWEKNRSSVAIYIIYIFIALCVFPFIYVSFCLLLWHLPLALLMLLYCCYTCCWYRHFLFIFFFIISNVECGACCAMCHFPLLQKDVFYV